MCGDTRRTVEWCAIRVVGGAGVIALSSVLTTMPPLSATGIPGAVAVSSGVRTAAEARAEPQKPAPDDSFDALYRRGSDVNAGLKTLTARFTETTTSTLLTRPLVAHGRLAVERPSHVALRYDDPPHVIVIDDTRMTLSWPSRNLSQVTNIASAQRRVQHYFVDSTPSELRQQFDIQSRKSEDRVGTYRLTMAPKRKQIREGLTLLTLWIDESSLLLSAMNMEFPNGDTKLMVFEDVVPNASIDPAAFRIER